jgi:hypothetical protein
VYVIPTPAIAGGDPKLRGKWQISTQGGLHQRWTANGKSLIFEEGQYLTSVSLSFSAEGIRAGLPQKLMPAAEAPPGPSYTWDMAPDGSRFLVLGDAAATVPRPLIVLLNWQSKLNARR